MARSLPWIGVIIGAATVLSAMRRKGVISGALDTGINAVPFVGMTKNAVEVMRGRDFFPDRYGSGVAAATRRPAVPRPAVRRPAVPRQ